MTNKRSILLIFLILTVAVISLIKSFHLFFQEFDNNVIYTGVSSLETAGDSFTFAVLGDNKNSVSTFGRIINSINKQKSIEFTMNTGDMVFDGNPIKYDFFLKQLKQFTNPMLPTPGNHDIADGGTERYLDIFGPMYYSFAHGSSFFIVLNNSNERDIDPWQLHWFEEELMKSKEYNHTFVFMHVPIYDPRLKMDEQPGHSFENLVSAEKVLQLLKQYPVEMVFAGHIHGYFRGDWDGVPYTITGGGGAEMLTSDPAHSFYHYIRVKIDGEIVNYDIVRINSPGFNFIDRVASFLWIYLYSFIVINYWFILLSIALITLLILYIKRYGKDFPYLIKFVRKKK